MWIQQQLARFKLEYTFASEIDFVYPKVTDNFQTEKVNVFVYAKCTLVKSTQPSYIGSLTSTMYKVCFYYCTISHSIFELQPSK